MFLLISFGINYFEDPTSIYLDNEMVGNNNHEMSALVWGMGEGNETEMSELRVFGYQLIGETIAEWTGHLAEIENSVSVEEKAKTPLESTASTELRTDDVSVEQVDEIEAPVLQQRELSFDDVSGIDPARHVHGRDVNDADHGSNILSLGACAGL